MKNRTFDLYIKRPFKGGNQKQISEQYLKFFNYEFHSVQIHADSMSLNNSFHSSKRSFSHLTSGKTFCLMPPTVHFYATAHRETSSCFNAWTVFGPSPEEPCQAGHTASPDAHLTLSFL